MKLMSPIFAVALGWCLIGNCAAQFEVTPPIGAVPVPGPASVPPQPGAQPQPGGQPQPAPKPTDPDALLLSKLQKVQFDRRPSVILRDWANPEPEIADPQGDPAKPAPKKDEQDIALEGLKRSVLRGNWMEVRSFFAGEFTDPKKAQQGYTMLLAALAKVPQAAKLPPAPGARPTPRGNAAFAEKHLLLPADVIGLADACPGELDPKTVIPGLGRMLRTAIARGHFPDTVLDLLDAGSARLGGQDAAKRADAARLLIAAGLTIKAGAFLPKPAETEDPALLDLLTGYYLALQSTEPDKEHLAGAWQITQRILAMKNISAEARQAALQRAVELAPQVEEELGSRWMSDSFTGDARRGREVLATIGALTSSGRAEVMPDGRLRRLKLQQTAAKALLSADEVDLEPWRAALNLMAMNWLAEGAHSQTYDRSQTLRPPVRWDRFGNMYYEQPQNRVQPQPQGNNQMPRAISTGELLKSRPDARWLEQVDEDLRPKFIAQYAQLFLKVNEPEDAFPHIESMAKSHPGQARELAEQFLSIWSENHNPNNARQRTYRYGYQFGYNQRANSIPLTRSKQQRNLNELAEWVARIKALPIEELDQRVLAGAFQKVHSSAEVYRLEAITGVFGSFEHMEPDTLAAFAQTMRRNLATVWRDQRVQEAAKTKRKDKEIIAEVARGYASAYAIVQHALQSHPENWRLALARACLALDELNFATEYVGGTGGQFVERREQAHAMFAQAAGLYIAKLPDDESKESSEAFEHWFYAALGAADLGALKESLQPAPAQVPLVKAALESLPGKAAERHMARFANALAARITSVKPELKQRYLKHGLAIVGDHEKAAEARKVFDYYSDLVTEIQLVARVDGSATVGHDEPFGVFVDLLHTKEIERESGGFAKYLTNQNNASFANNYGRPTQNYREKFEDTARAALEEHFEVQSVTFHDSKIRSRGTARDGWRTTPYAYILMRAKTPEVDKVPALQIDLDFLDTSGFVILPIATAPQPIDARPAAPAQRTPAKLKLAQILDERQASEGLLGLEVKASAHGLVPPLEQLIDIKGGDFELTETEGGELMISQMDAEGDKVAAISERIWTLKFKGAEGADTFAFPKPLAETEELAYQRYDDADLVTAEAEVSLTGDYGGGKSNWILAGVVCGILIIASILALVFWPRGGPQSEIAARYHLPGEITPFTVVGLLRRIRDENNLPADAHAQLRESIDKLERHYFERSRGDDPDLEALAKEWVKRAA